MTRPWKGALLPALLFLLLGLLPASAGAEAGGQVIETSEYLLFVPAGVAPGDLRPLVLGFHPSGDARWAMSVWQPSARRHRWFVLASKVYHNTDDITPMVASIRASIRDLAATRPIDPHCLIAGGLSGGGMFSHIMAYMEPKSVQAVVANCGMINRDLVGRADYPRQKLAVFLASPTDFRYKEMQADQQRLKSLGWETKWVEFPGGHAPAPEKLYAEAADWINGMLIWSRSRQK